MIFAGIDVNIIGHEKALLAGVEAFGLWAWGMCYAQLYETNGRLPRVAVLTAMGGRRNEVHAKRLVEVGLWLSCEDGSWAIFNYGKKNQTAEEIQAKKAASADRARRWRERRNAPSNADVTRDVRVTDTTGQRARTDPPPEPPPPPDNTTREQYDLVSASAEPSPTSEPEPVTKVRSRRKPETPCPAYDASPADLQAWADRWKIPTGSAEFDKFVENGRKKDLRWRDWAAAWRTWLKRAPEFAGRPLFDRGGVRPRQPLGDPNAAWLKSGSDL